MSSTLAEVERNWFRRVLAVEQAPPIYDLQADPLGRDGGFELAEGATLRDALVTWSADPRQRFWLEITDRHDVGVDLHCPQRGSDG